MRALALSLHFIRFGAARHGGNAIAGNSDGPDMVIMIPIMTARANPMMASHRKIE
jgi:hypothetical protein